MQKKKTNIFRNYLANTLNLLICSLLTCLISNPAWSSPPTIGKSLEKVSIQDNGELNLTAEGEHYTPWESARLTGKIRVVQHMAGRKSAKSVNDAFINALKTSKLNYDVYQTTTIINLNDALFGTSGFVMGKIKKNKKEFPNSSFVLDAKGDAQKIWQLSPRSSAIIVLDENGNVIFFKDGKLNQSEIKQVISQLRTETNRLQTNYLENNL